MSMTIDNLRVDHRVTVLRDFTDAAGTTMRAGESGVITGLSWGQLRMEILITIERSSGRVELVFPLKSESGPRNGHMREYFEVGEDVATPRLVPAFHERSLGEMIVPLPQSGSAALHDTDPNMDGPDKLTEMEEAMRKQIDHIGVAASIAEVYARRMRAFQRAGNEPRAIAAFKLAVEWMATYAGWATSGGEGEALSNERDRFRAALAREFGYDPTENIS